ncbi:MULTISPECIES: ZIP family metal transporter [Polaribacter]|uniref:Divalent cation transporter n=1 Tax=Polaribacter sejongensis TaxID=985043 RepID=A0AAJ1VJ75_9FLAO|nr:MULTISPECIES: divalent cation transporter [Polaribacter]MDN3620667.1 divalent cation transporter [Polaribacter undariae]UWD32483.1 divalent cation transporter [Polaribacter undariae]
MLQNLLLFSGFAGITVFIGGLLANFFNHHIRETPVKYEITHTMMSFGAGIILSAIALVLIPKGLEELAVLPMAISFTAGVLIFLYIDQYLAKNGSKNATLLAMMMDFIPESIALGATFAVDPKMATLLAVFIGLQNLPEAFNSYRDMVGSGFTAQKTLIIFFVLSFFGIGGALIGHYFLTDSPILTAHLMTFASGGILYLLINDIIPESKLKNNYLTSLGAAFGFLVGIIGEKLI